MNQGKHIYIAKETVHELLRLYYESR